MKFKYIVVTFLATGILTGATLTIDKTITKADTLPAPKAVVSPDKSIVLSAHETAPESLILVKQNAPFKVMIPDETKLPSSQLTGVFMDKVQEGTSDRHVDLFYATPNGEVHIWQSNLNPTNSEKNHVKVVGYTEEKVSIANHDWYYTQHQDEKNLLIFTTQLNNNIVQVSGKVPYDELISIISSLK